MPSLKSWQEMISEGRQRSRYTAQDLYTAEKAAYVAHDARVKEMAKHGGGIVTHEGKNGLAVISNAIALLAIGDEKDFKAAVDRYAEKAAFDPIHFSPVAHGLIAVDGFLKQKEGAQR
jgi:hypothetical protein